MLICILAQQVICGGGSPSTTKAWCHPQKIDGLLNSDIMKHTQKKEAQDNERNL
jgi:hypothetical protein